jgi:zinc protease
MKNYLLLLALFLFSCQTLRQKHQKAREDIANKESWRFTLPEESKDAIKPVFPAVKRSSLKNGLTILVVEDNRLPIADVSVILKQGAVNDPLGKSGLFHLSSMMLKEGAGNKNSLELAEAIANLGTEVSIHVGKDLVELSAGVLSTKVDDIMSLLSDMVEKPRMEQSDFNRVKLQHQTMLTSQQGGATYVAQTKFLLSAYGEKHPYAYPSTGTINNVKDISLEDVKKTHAKYFGANDAALIVVGNITLEEVEKMASKYFGDWKKTKVKAVKIADPAKPKEMHTVLVERNDSPQTYILVGQPAIKQTDADLASIEVLESIIAGSPASRLGANLREAKGWTYGVASSVSPMRGKGPMLIGTSIQAPFGADALAEILKEFENLSTNLVSDEELFKAQNGILQSFAARYSTLSKVSDEVGNAFVYSLPYDNDEKYYDQISKVDKESIRKACARVFKKDQLVAVAVGDLEALKPAIAKINVGKVSVETEKK